jgi:hypothetical protein
MKDTKECRMYLSQKEKEKFDKATQEGKRKWLGTSLAREWTMYANPIEIIHLAATTFEYGTTLNDLQQQGFNVPASGDIVLSSGFYKKVRGWVSSMIYSRQGNDKMFWLHENQHKQTKTQLV